MTRCLLIACYQLLLLAPLILSQILQPFISFFPLSIGSISSDLDQFLLVPTPLAELEGQPIICWLHFELLSILKIVCWLKKMFKKSLTQTVACHAVVKPYTLC